MEIDALVKWLKKFPKKYGVELDAETMAATFTVKEPHRSMQTDAGAFEGWLLLLHEKIPRWKISLQIPQSELNSLSTLRFHRFLYRVHQFSKMNYTWLCLSPSLQEQTAGFIERYYAAPKRIALPRGDASKNDMVRHLLQSKFSAEDSILLALPECEGCRIHTGLPVAVFRAPTQREAKPSNLIFPQNRSVIDLWCVKEDVLNIFLLRYQTPTLSVVSELYFYANWCRDVFLQGKESGFTFPPRPKTPHRGFDALYDGASMRTFTRINAWFLADTFHPLINEAYFCDMLSSRDIRFHCLKYSYDFPVALETGTPEETAGE